MLMSKLSLIISASFLSASIMADTSVLQYQSSNDQVAQFSIPLDHIDRIVSHGSQAWAYDKNDDGDVEVSYFDGTKWQTPYDLPSHLTTTEIVTLQSFDNQTGIVAKLDQYNFMKDSSGDLEWQTAKSSSNEHANGRYWYITDSPFKQNQEVVYVNQTIGQDNLSLLTDAASAKAIASITTSNVPIADYSQMGYAYYDSATNTDYLKIAYRIDPTSGKQNGDNMVALYTCSVPHDSTNAAADVRCSASTLDLQKLMPAYGNDNLDFGNFTVMHDGTVMAVIEDLTTAKNIWLWSKDDGATWSYSQGFTYSNPGFGSINPTNIFNTTCLDETMQSGGMNQYTFPPSFVCLDATAKSPATIKTMAMQALDMDKDEVTTFGVVGVNTEQGLWVSVRGKPFNPHLYFQPFASSSTAELPSTPGAAMTAQSPFVVMTHTTGSDKVITCSFTSYTDQGKTYSGMHVQIAKNDGKQWAWTTPATSVAEIPSGDVCRLSHKDDASAIKDTVYTSDQVIWVYPFKPAPSQTTKVGVKS